MSHLYTFGHKWGYDFESMKEKLQQLGFSHITKENPFDSLIPQIEELEPKTKGRLLETSYVEAKKV